MPRAARHPCPPPWSVAWRLWVVLFQEGLCESWLVEAPQCQTYSNHQPRRDVADLIIAMPAGIDEHPAEGDRKSTRLNSSHRTISYAVFCLKKKKITVNKHKHDRVHTT